jgi:acetyl-CoA acetyltransferase
MYRLARSDGRYFLRTMCIGVDQRISLIIGNM